MVEVGEVDAAHHVQRLVVVGVHAEVLQHQLAADDADGVVVEAHADAVGDADEMGIFDEHLTVDIRMTDGTPDSHAAFRVAVETEDLVGCKAVDERERHMCHIECGIDDSFAFVLICSTEQAELLVVEQQTGLDSVGVVFVLQIDELRADIADGSALIGHFCHTHIGGYGDVLVPVLQDMVVAVELARDAGEVRDDGRQFSQVDTMEADGEVLQHGGVLMLGVYLHTRLVVRDEVYLCLDLLTAGEEDVVVFVQVELLVTHRRTVGQEPEAQTFVFHLRCGTDSDTHAALRVVKPQAGQCPVLMYVTVDESVEDELRIFLVVADLSLIGQPVAFMNETQPDGVDLNAVVVEREEMPLSVDACLRRGGEVERQLLEVGACGTQEVGDRIVALTLQMELHHRQQGLHGRLVNDLVLELSDDGVGEGGELTEQSLVAARRVKFQDEVAALHTGIGSVRIGLQQNADITWGVGLFPVFHIDIVQAPADVMGVFHVGTDFQTAVGADGERFLNETHLVEVGLGEVAADGTLDLMGVEQQFGADAAFKNLVVTDDVELSATVGECDRSHQVVQIPAAVLQSLDAGVGSKAALG